MDMRKLWVGFVAFFILAGVAGFGSAASAQGGSDAETIVDAAYAGLLGRSAEPAGREYWVGQIEAGARPGDVVGSIGDADEHRRFVVTEFYRDILEREPDAAGLAFWSEGIIDRLTARSLRVEILASEEFFLRSGGTDEAFVSALYRNLLNRDPEPAGLRYWSGLLEDGASRVVVAGGIVESLEEVLQPGLSIESASPRAGDLGSVASIEIDLDRPIDPQASEVIVSAGGLRVEGSISGDPDDPSVLQFEATTAVRAAPGDRVVVTVFATTPAETDRVVESIDYSFVYREPNRSDLADPEGELIIAFYGHPTAPVLGIAGEGTPQQALERLQAQAAPYAVTGRPIVPAFEMIATLVTASPGADGLYRSRASEADLRPYLDAIRSVDGRMFLDIQPGRADPLGEARAYESLLLEPEVGIALDPEWVVGPTQTPQGRIGTMDASTINRVSAYLSELVADNDLPPKILIVHRFRPSMVTNTDQIVSRPGVRILFHADGEGGPAAKIGDYDNLLPDRFERGIKIFYDEDSPTMTPSQVLERTNPDPTFISYQ